MADFDPSKAVVRALGDYLVANMAAMAGKQALENFPNPAEELDLPALSIHIADAPFTPGDPYVVSKSDPNEDNESTVKYHAGDYAIRLQVDLWAGDKEERFTLYDQLFGALNPLPGGSPMGLTLNLADYHDQKAHFSLLGYKNDDSEASAQRSEWRVKCDVLVDVRAIRAKTEYLITEEVGFGNNEEIDSQLQILDTIPNE